MSASTIADIDTEATAYLEGVHVVVLETSEPGDEFTRYRRRVYMTIGAAQRALDKATERGHRGAIVLCRLNPVGGAL